MMNQSEFAKYLGVSPNQYNIWERQVKQPNLDNDETMSNIKYKSRRFNRVHT